MCSSWSQTLNLLVSKQMISFVAPIGPPSACSKKMFMLASPFFIAIAYNDGIFCWPAACLLCLALLPFLFFDICAKTSV